jgi:hypothetical protein
MRKIYLASSWRNLAYPIILKRLRDAGHEVHDFRENGFRWEELHPDILEMNPKGWLKQIRSKRAETHFRLDLMAMEWADTCVVVERAGNSAHIEAGWMKGQGKDVHIFLPPFCEMETELMLLLFEPQISHDFNEILKRLSVPVGAMGMEVAQGQSDDLVPETEPLVPKIQKQD